MDKVTLIGAFSSGLLTFLSPCILPLIPVYFSMLLGSTEFGDTKRGELVFRTILFILGFGSIFILLGLSTTLLGEYLLKNIFYFKKLAGIVIIFFAFFIMGIFNFKFLMKTKKLELNLKASYSGNFLLGFSFGFAWTPCVGPVLGSILVLASTSKNMSYGFNLLLAYTLGISIPFLVTAVIGENLLKRMKSIVKYSKIIKVVSGIVLILFAVLVFNNKI